MLEEEFETSIKVVVVGNGGVGKTSMIRRFCHNNFTDQYKKTIGVDFLEKDMFVDALQEDVKLMLWDTAGQEEFDAITRSYYRGAGAGVLAFSTTDRASFMDVKRWKAKVEAECGKIPMVLIQNKVDLMDQAAVQPNEAEALARELNLKFYRVCVKDGLNVSEVFEDLAVQYVEGGGARNGSGSTTSIDELAESQKAPPRSESQLGDAADQINANGVITLGSSVEPSKRRTNGKKRRLGGACMM